MYVAHLHQQGLKASTIKSKLSAIGFVYESSGLCNPTQSFTVQKLLVSYTKSDKYQPTRKSINLKLLKRLVHSISKSCDSDYNKRLFVSAFTLMYHAALRVSEVCKTPSSKHTLQFQQITTIRKRSTKLLSIKFTSFKHSHNPTASLVIHPDKKSTCPVKSFHRYTELRGNFKGPAFCLKDGTPLTRVQLLRVLHDHLTLTGYQCNEYNTHSFRIGKTTDLANQGYSHTQIAMIGRWRSNAYLKYIKPSHIHTV